MLLVCLLIFIHDSRWAEEWAEVQINSAFVTCQHLWHKGNKYLNTDMGKQIIKTDYGLIGVLDSSLIMHFHCGLARVKKNTCPLDCMHLWQFCVKVCLDGTSSSLHDPESPIPVYLFKTQSPNREMAPKGPAEFLVATVASSPEVASCPSVPLKRSAFGYTWAQTQVAVDTSSPLAYNLWSLPAFVCGYGFSSLHLWVWRTHPGVALPK